jgi:hypothetical protein
MCRFANPDAAKLVGMPTEASAYANVKMNTEEQDFSCSFFYYDLDETRLFPESSNP